MHLMLRGFSWKSGVTDFASVEARRRVSDLARRICLPGHPTRLNRDNQRPAQLPYFVAPSQCMVVPEC